MFSNAVFTSAAVAFLFPHLSIAATIDSDSLSVPGCQSLIAAGLKTQVYYPTDAKYKAREASYWSLDSPLSPSCIVQPRNTAEVSLALKTLANASGNFAVRSGGHTQWAGGSDVHNGVTIDLGLLTNATYNPSTNLASIQPGPRWGDVFTALAAQGVVVAGGRDADVGIGGFLTGGGNSYYAGRMGFACDSVVNFEVVLANGSVVNANKSSNADLWKALKGGSGNFGIVTRFDMTALPSVPLWGGLRASNRTYGDQITAALVNFTDNNYQNPEDAFIINFTYNPSLFTEVVVAQVIVDTTGVVNAPAFNQIQQVPTILEDVKTRSMADIATAYILPSGYQNVWFTLTVKNNPAIVKKAGILHDQIVQELLQVLNATDFTTQCLFQPVPSFFAQRSVAQGGNVLGLDSVTDNALLWLGTAAVKTAAQEKIVRDKLTTLSKGIEDYANSVGGNIPWRYLNYADSTQDPLKSYGTTNVDFIKKVAAKYDPKAVFQKKVPSGFKISRI